MQKRPLLQLKSVTIKVGSKPILKDISFEIQQGENLLITGPSGSGKTVLAKLIAGIWKKHTGENFRLVPEKDIQFIAQQANFSQLFTGRTAYYDQRFDGNEKEASPFVKSLFQPEKITAQQKLWWQQLSVSALEEKRLHQLSNGESKRIQLALALVKSPKLLALDNPFIGLDVDSRILLHQLLESLMQEGISIILIGKPEEMPSTITSVLVLEQGKILYSGSREGFENHLRFIRKRKNVFIIPEEIIQELSPVKEVPFDYALEMNHVHVIYAEKKVLSDINWKVKRGECWALIGHNGAGKSTLLSLITADNPQGYKNDFKLFDLQRGSGESIWEIKSKIGFVSPELHRFFERKKGNSKEVQQSEEEYNQRGLNIAGVNVIDSVLSGFKDEVGFSSATTSQQKRIAVLWLKALGIQELKDQRLSQLSLGEQRLVLLARALVKNPPLLLLDEPCQGLDQDQIDRFKAVVDTVCVRFKKTLIYVSHYENEIPSCVTKRIILKAGKVEAITP